MSFFSGLDCRYCKYLPFSVLSFGTSRKFLHILNVSNNREATAHMAKKLHAAQTTDSPYAGGLKISITSTLGQIPIEGATVSHRSD